MAQKSPFTESATNRIGKAVRKTEKVGSVATNPNSPAFLPNVHARLVAQSTTDATQWSWQQVIRKADGTYEDGPLKSDLDSTNNMYFPAYTLNGESVSVGLRVVLSRMPERQTDGSTILKYAIIATGANLTVYITSNIGAAQYQGNSQQGTATNLSLSGITNDGPTVLVLNLCEVGSGVSSPFLANGSIVIGTVKGTDSDTGYPVVVTSQMYGYLCTPGLSSSSTGTSSSSSGGG